MKYKKLITLIFLAAILFATDSQARLIKPKDGEGTDGFLQVDERFINPNEQSDIRDMTYSATWDASLDPYNLTITSFPVCMYDRTQNPPKLIVNNFFTSDKAKVIMGIKKASSCPLPGSQVFSDYPQAIAGEFLISGVLCVVNSIIFDSMFRVYCTIVLWFYNILFSMVIIYVMFYGLSIMLGIGKDPIKEAPKRILKIIIIFSLAVNAQVGFRYIHNGFLTALNSFSEMLVDMQPYTDENGHPAYKKTLIDTALGTSFMANQGKLLNEEGTVWAPVKADTQFYDMIYYNYKKITDPAYNTTDQQANENALNDFRETGAVKKGLMPGLPSDYSDDDKVVLPEDYIPFRIPEMQWTYKEFPAKNSGNYKVYPVFQDLVAGVSVSGLTNGAYNSWGNLEKDGYKIFACISDLKWNAFTFDEKGNPRGGRLERYPRCQKSLWPTIPNIAPYGEICLFKIDNRNQDIDGDGDNDEVDAKIRGKVIPLLSSGSGGETYCTVAEKADLSDFKDLIHPPRLKDPKYNDNNGTPLNFGDDFLDITELNVVCDPIFWWTCRKPFQGVLSKIDSMFNSVMGGDSTKNISALAIALAMWGAGSGMLIAAFLMTGVVAMTVATMQLVWTFVTAIMALSFLLMLSPIFISCALFKVTENMFKGWLSACISYAMQPFLILAFIFMLSNIASLDRLSKLAKTEITERLYYMGGEDGETTVSFTAKSFAYPLYEKPKDFDVVFYKDARNIDDSELQTRMSNSIFITAEQREKYLKRKGDYVLSYWLAYKSGVEISDLYVQDDANFINESVYPDIKELMSIWFDGKFKDYNTNQLVRTNKRGIDALAYYMIYNSGQSNKFQELMTCWQQGCELDGKRYWGVVPKDITSQQCNSSADCSGALCIEGYCTRSGTASPDDGDSFVGEPPSRMVYGAIYGGSEFPECRKYCPQFKPAWNPTSNNNPIIGVNSTQMADGSNCPDLKNNKTGQTNTDTDGDGVINGDGPDVCVTPTQCTKYCMGVPNSHKTNFAYLKYCMGVPNSHKTNFAYLITGGIIWIILNIITAAFMTQVPRIAEALSRWESSGGGNIVIGGASRKYDETGMDEWTKAERSQTYNVGGLFDTGIISGNAGAIPALLDKTARYASGPKKKVDMATGEIVDSGYGIPYWRKDAQANQARKQQAIEDYRVRVIREYKNRLGLRDNESMNNKQKEVDAGIISRISRYATFAEFRPAVPTGLKHADIWGAIEKALHNSGSATNEADIRQAIQTEVDRMIQEFIKKRAEEKSGKENNGQ